MTAPSGPAAAPPTMAPLVNPTPPRFEPLSGGLANAVFAAMLMANTPAISAGLRNLVVQVPMCPLQLLETREPFCSRGSLHDRIRQPEGRRAGDPPMDRGKSWRGGCRVGKVGSPLPTFPTRHLFRVPCALTAIRSLRAGAQETAAPRARLPLRTGAVARRARAPCPA